MNGQIWGATAIIVAGYIIGSYFQHRSVESLRKEMEANINALRAEIGALRSEMAALRIETRAEIAALRSEMGALRAEMKQGFAELRLEFHTQISDLAHRLESVEHRVGLVQQP